MKPLQDKISFETKNGIVDIYSMGNGWFFEFVSGEQNGLHNNDPFKSFDKVFLAAKKRGAEKIY